MSKKRRCQPVSGSMSKKARHSGSGHQRFSSRVPMWFGTMSRITPEPLGGSARSAASPPSSSETRVGVDDVVAVRRALARLQRRREVQVRDAEVAQVGDELARRMEVEVARELQAVRGAQRRQRRPSQHARRERATSGHRAARARPPRSPGSASGSRWTAPATSARRSGAAGSRELDVLVVGVEQQQERVVLRSRSPRASRYAELLAVEEQPDVVQRRRCSQSRCVIRRPSGGTTRRRAARTPSTRRR